MSSNRWVAAIQAVDPPAIQVEVSSSNDPTTSKSSFSDCPDQPSMAFSKDNLSLVLMILQMPPRRTEEGQR